MVEQEVGGRCVSLLPSFLLLRLPAFLLSCLTGLLATVFPLPNLKCLVESKKKVRQVKEGKPDRSHSGQLLQQHIFVGTTRAFEAAFNQRRVKKRNADHLVHVVTMNNKNTSKRMIMRLFLFV